MIDNSKEESDIYKSHLKWIEDNMEQLIQNEHIKGSDKAKIDNYRDKINKIDLAPLSQCSKGVNKITTYKGLSEGLTGAVEVLFAIGVLKPNDKGQER